MRIILAATPETEFVDPALALARLLRRGGHELVLLTGSRFSDRVRAMNVEFAPLPPPPAIGDNVDPSPADRATPDGPGASANDRDHRAVAALTGQHHALAGLIGTFRPDGVITDQMFLGAVPLMLSPRGNRPFVIAYGLTPLSSPDTQALSAGTRSGRAQQCYEHQLRALGVTPGGSPLDVASLSADVFWQGGLPELEEAAGPLPDHILHVGLWPALAIKPEIPAWAERLQDGRRLVLVTGGNAASDHVELLLLPTIRALAHRRDLVVIGSTHGQELSGLSVPENARLADQLPIEWILPHTHALVTSDDHGAVLQALAFGVPMVVAGRGARTPNIAARIGSAGAGIDLGTAEPGEANLRAAVEALLVAESPERQAAHAIAARFGGYDAGDIILTSLDEQHRKMRRAA